MKNSNYKKNHKRLIVIISSIFLFLFFSLLMIFIIKSEIKYTYKYIYFTFLIMIFLSITGLLIWAILYIKEKREIINRSFDKYIEENLAWGGVGILIFNNSFEIIWCSKFIEEIFDKKIIGIKLSFLSKELQENLEKENNFFEFSLGKNLFFANIKYKTNTIIIKNITEYNFLLDKYLKEKLVVGEIEIDNFQQLQIILSEENNSKIRLKILEVLDEISEKYNLFYRQYENGKYFIFTNRYVLNNLIKTKFNFLDKFKKHKILNENKITLSVGIGYGTTNFKELVELAKDGLAKSISRGGDQVAILQNKESKPLFFGSKTENINNVSKVEIKKITKNLEDKLKSDVITKVIIYGHKLADLDSVGASIGLYNLCKNFKKDVYIQNSTFDSTTLRSLSILNAKKFFINKKQAQIIQEKDNTLVIIVDTAEISRVENEKIIQKLNLDNLFIFDHHRIFSMPENVPIKNIYIDSSASSASEIITEVIQFTNKNINIPKFVAQMLLNGIVLDTKQFTKSTSTRTFAAAAWLENKGASSYESNKLLKLPPKYFKWISQMNMETQEIKPGFFLSYSKEEVPEDIISIAADEILRVDQRKASFVFAKIPKKNIYKLSARSNNVNVQIIAENLGGGGHFNTAAVKTDESLEVFKDNIIQAIVSYKGE